MPPYSVLYADDEHCLLESTRIVLEEEGEFSVVTAPSAAAALGLLEEREFDAIISDYQMPRMDGITFLKEVRARHGTVPFILFTGKGREEVVIEALNSGADFYLQKGVRPDSVYAELANMLRIAIQRKHSAEIIRANEERLRLAQAVGRTGSWEYLPQQGTFWGSEQAFRICGIPPTPDGTVEYDRVRKILVNADHIHRVFYEKAGTGRSITLDFACDPADGSHRRYIHSIAEIVRDGNGKITRITGVIRDETDEKLAAVQTRETTGRFEAIFRTSPVAIAYLTRDGRIADANPACCRLFGAGSPQDMQDAKPEIFSLIPPDERIRLEHGETIGFETDLDCMPSPILTCEQGIAAGKIALAVLVTPVENNGENGTGCLVQMIDISSQKRASEAQKEANRKLGLLLDIARIDIHRELFTLDGYLRLARGSGPGRQNAPEYLDCCAGILAIVEQQIRFMREYHMIGTGQPAWQDAGICADSARAALGPGSWTIDTAALSGLLVHADPLLTKVFSCLLENAIRHGGDGDRAIRFSRRIENGRLILACEDNGTGIPLPEKEIIFSRGYGRDTGYGLFLAREILSSTGISIRETGEPGHGARFELEIPTGAWRYAGQEIPAE